MWCEETQRLTINDEKYTDLALLAVHPKAQKGGVGRLLCQWGIDQAKKDEADVLLGSTECKFRLPSPYVMIHQLIAV